MLPVSGGREVFFDQPHDDAVRQKRRAWRSGMTRNTADSDSYGNKGAVSYTHLTLPTNREV